MSSADPTEGVSRLTNETNSVNASDAGISGPDESGAVESREIPTPAERASEFVDEYSDRAMLPLTAEHGTSLRREYTNEQREEWRSHDGEASGVDRTYEPVTWGAAVEEMLEKHEETRRTTVNLEKGRPGTEEYRTYSVEADNRFMADYQQTYFAQLKGALREFVGGERPSGGECSGKFENPHLVLLTRSASAAPGGERLPPVDHANALAESWEPVYHTLRNTMRALGFELGEEWVYDRRWEPHKGDRGGGINHCYAHEHVVLVVDGEVTPEMFDTVLEKHVEECDPAGADAHTTEEAVNIKEAGEMDNIAAYVADYTGIQPEDLLERSTEYVGFAATVSAANLRTISRSDAMHMAATADKCKQQYESDRAEQSHEHGETVVPSDRRGYDFECIECGSPHGIDQSPDTLTEARIDRPTVADGGVDREEELRERWPSARAAVAYGETPDDRERRERIENYLAENPDATPTEVLGALTLPPDAEEQVREVMQGVDPDESVAFEDLPEWSVKSVTVGTEEYPAGPGSGVDLVEVSYPEWELRERVDARVEDGLVTCDCGVTVGTDSLISHLLTHGSDPDILAGFVT